MTVREFSLLFAVNGLGVLLLREHIVNTRNHVSDLAYLFGLWMYRLTLGAVVSLCRSGCCSKTRSGEGGIRTRGTLAGTHDFQSCTFDHSVTSPGWVGLG